MEKRGSEELVNSPNIYDEIVLIRKRLGWVIFWLVMILGAIAGLD